MTINQAELGRWRYLRTCVRLHCRDLPKGLGQAPGCRKHRRGRLVLFCTCRLQVAPDGIDHTCRQHVWQSVYAHRVVRRVALEDLIDAHDVARILGLSHRNTVSLYMRRYEDMPRPVLDLGRGRPSLWLRPEIERWHARQAALGRTRPRGGSVR